MSVKKIFITLVTIVACVMIGALILNTLLPNVTTTLIDSTEDMIYKASGMSFDFNNNSNSGDSGNGSYSGDQQGGTSQDLNTGVEGFN